MSLNRASIWSAEDDDDGDVGVVGSDIYAHMTRQMNARTRRGFKWFFDAHNRRMIRNLVLSGGSVRTVSVVGCLLYLHEQRLLQGVTTVVGTSAGAILGFMLVLGYTPTEVVGLLKDVLIGKGYHKLRLDDLLSLNIFETFGLDSGENIVAFLRDVLEKATGLRDVTFMELTKRCGKNLVVCVANVSRQSTEYMCVDDTPDVSVITAIRMSGALPIVFSPVRHSNGDLYVDGALYEALPIGYISARFNNDMLRDTLAISMTNATGKNMLQSARQPDLPSYLAALITSLVSRVNRNVRALDLLKTRKIRVFELDVESPNAMFCLDIDNMNFAIDAAKVDAAVAVGYAAIERYFRDSERQKVEVEKA